ncbi:MAG TPA: hypothetical protein VLV50_02600 [Stellaceae bacterium]|nr:hypothetical protein [Stellaceae bacterium]
MQQERDWMNERLKSLRSLLGTVTDERATRAIREIMAEIEKRLAELDHREKRR